MSEASRIEQFKEVVALFPDDVVARFGLAGAYLDAGEAADAAREFQSVVDGKPEYTAAYRGLGRALERLGRFEEAKAIYRRGISVGERTGDLQTKKEMEVFLRRLEQRGG
jgi:predicted Zn-dependent protease